MKTRWLLPLVVTPVTNAMMRTSANLPRRLDDVAAQGPLPRTLVVGASIDPVVPPAPLRIAVDQAVAWLLTPKP